MYLNSQSERVSQNQHKHDVLKLAGVDDSPEFKLRRVFGNVDLDGLSFKSIIHTLTLEGEEAAEELVNKWVRFCILCPPPPPIATQLKNKKTPIPTKKDNFRDDHHSKNFPPKTSAKLQLKNCSLF